MNRTSTHHTLDKTTAYAMPPACRSKNGRRGPISPPQDWEALRLRLTVMYHGQGMKLPEIKAILATDLGFQAR